MRHYNCICNKKENLSYARFNDFFSNFAYRSESTENCSINFFKENNISIDNTLNDNFKLSD